MGALIKKCAEVGWRVAQTARRTIIQFVGEVDSPQRGDVGEVALPLAVEKVALK